MRQSIRRIALLLGVLAALGLATVTFGPGLPGADAQGAAAVAIVDFAFQPASLEVTAGTTVTWTNSGAATHTVTADNGAFDSGRLAPGATFSQTFDTAGTFTYHCDIHPQMTGTIVVSEASSAPAAASNQGAAQPQAGKQEQAPQVVQMPSTGVGTISLLGSTSAFMFLMALAAVALAAGAALDRRRA